MPTTTGEESIKRVYRGKVWKEKEDVLYAVTLTSASFITMFIVVSEP